MVPVPELVKAGVVVGVGTPALFEVDMRPSHRCIERMPVATNKSPSGTLAKLTCIMPPVD
jgi:hypothetical protein